MNYTKIIIAVGILAGILLFNKTSPKLLKGVLIGLILSFAMLFFENKFLVSVSFFSFGLLSLLYTLISRSKKKWLHFVIGAFAFLSFIFKALHLPFALELKLAMIIPIICFALLFRDWKACKSEMSILGILFAYELSEFIKLTEL